MRAAVLAWVELFGNPGGSLKSLDQGARTGGGCSVSLHG